VRAVLQISWRVGLNKITLAAVSIVVTLLLLEGAVRVFWPQNPEYYDSDKFTRPVAGTRFHENVPNSFSDSFIGVPVNINHLGLRGPEVSIAKPPGSVRILGVGDSITFGYGVRSEETFLSLLERTLNGSAQNNVRYEVLNSGVGATGFDYYYYVLRTKAVLLQPDVVIVNICLNDIHVYRDATGTTLAPPGTPKKKTRVRRLNEWLLRHSQLYLTCYVGLKSVLYRYRVLDLQQIQGGTFLPLDPPSASQDRAWASSLDLLSNIVDLSRRSGYRLLLVVFPVEMQLSPDTLKLYRDQYHLRLGPEVLSGEPQRRIAEFGASHGVPVLDLLPAFRARGSERLYLRNKSIKYDPAHPSVRGHQIAADEIVHSLRSAWPTLFPTVSP
jgi:lysophospholipase L1-like esterase